MLFCAATGTLCTVPGTVEKKKKKKKKQNMLYQYSTVPRKRITNKKNIIRLPGLDSSAPVLFFFFHIYKK